MYEWGQKFCFHQLFWWSHKRTSFIKAKKVNWKISEESNGEVNDEESVMRNLISGVGGTSWLAYKMFLLL